MTDQQQTPIEQIIARLIVPLMAWVGDTLVPALREAIQPEEYTLLDDVTIPIEGNTWLFLKTWRKNSEYAGAEFYKTELSVVDRNAILFPQTLHGFSSCFTPEFMSDYNGIDRGRWLAREYLFEKLPDHVARIGDSLPLNRNL